MQALDRIQKTLHEPVSNTHSSLQSECETSMVPSATLIKLSIPKAQTSHMETLVEENIDASFLKNLARFPKEMYPV